MKTHPTIWAHYNFVANRAFAAPLFHIILNTLLKYAPSAKVASALGTALWARPVSGKRLVAILVSL